MFKEGQKVVCIGNPNGTRDPLKGEIFPTKGEIYTVRENAISFSGIAMIRLMEIVNPIIEYDKGFSELGFDVRGFRPVDTTYGEQVCEELERITEPELV